MKKSKKITLYSVAFVALVAIALMAAGKARAVAEQPGQTYEWVGQDGSICTAIITGYGVALDCDCPCHTDCPACEECETPTPEPTPEPTPTPEEVKCNAGRGNGSEGDPDCDPGNSGGHNQGGD